MAEGRRSFAEREGRSRMLARRSLMEGFLGSDLDLSSGD